MSERRPDPAELVRLLAHDTRNVAGALSATLEYVRVVVPDDAEGELREALDDSMVALADLLRMLEQIHWLAAWTAGMPIAQAEPGDVREALEEVASRGHRARVVLSVPSEPLRTTAAGVALVRVLDVLVANAARHGGGGPVQVGARATGKFVVVDIGDGGPAVARTLRERAFELAEQWAMKRESGARYQPGAGLAIAKLVIEALGGRIEASGSDGAALLRVVLPRE